MRPGPALPLSAFLAADRTTPTQPRAIIRRRISSVGPTSTSATEFFAADPSVHRVKMNKECLGFCCKPYAVVEFLAIKYFSSLNLFAVVGKLKKIFEHTCVWPWHLQLLVFKPITVFQERVQVTDFSHCHKSCA